MGVDSDSEGCYHSLFGRVELGLVGVTCLRRGDTSGSLNELSHAGRGVSELPPNCPFNVSIAIWGAFIVVPISPLYFLTIWVWVN